MTEELEKEAEESAKQNCPMPMNWNEIDVAEKAGYIKGYIAGATENGVQWHDLRKDPKDLPKDCYDVLDEAGYKVFYHHKEGVWKNASGSKIVKVIAWCEIPTFDKE